MQVFGYQNLKIVIATSRYLEYRLYGLIVHLNIFLFERFDVFHIIVSKYYNKIDKVYILKSS